MIKYWKEKIKLKENYDHGKGFILINYRWKNGSFIKEKKKLYNASDTTFPIWGVFDAVHWVDDAVVHDDAVFTMMQCSWWCCVHEAMWYWVKVYLHVWCYFEVNLKCIFPNKRHAFYSKLTFFSLFFLLYCYEEQISIAATQDLRIINHINNRNKLQLYEH